jgi:hypothetical protein
MTLSRVRWRRRSASGSVGYDLTRLELGIGGSLFLRAATPASSAGSKGALACRRQRFEDAPWRCGVVLLRRCENMNCPR